MNARSIVFAAAASAASIVAPSALAALTVQDLGGATVSGSLLADYNGKEIRNGTLVFSGSDQNDARVTSFAVGAGATVRFDSNLLPNADDGTITVKQGGRLETGPNSKFYIGYSRPGTNRLIIDGGTAEFNGNWTDIGSYPLGVPCIWKKSALNGVNAVLHVVNGGTLRTTVDGAHLVMGFGSGSSYTYDWRNINGELVVSNATLSVNGEIFPAGQKNNTAYTGRNYVLFKDADVTCRQIYVYKYPQDVTVEFDNATLRWAGHSTSFIGRNSEATDRPYRILAGGLKLDIPSGMDLVIDSNAAPLFGVGGVTKIGGGSLTWSKSGSMEFTGPMSVAEGKFTSSLSFASSAFSADGETSELALSGALTASRASFSASNGGRLTLSGATISSSVPSLALATGGSTDFFTRDGVASMYLLRELSLGPGAVLDIDVSQSGGAWTCDSLVPQSASVTATAANPVVFRLHSAQPLPDAIKLTLLSSAVFQGDASLYRVDGIPGTLSAEGGALVFEVKRGMVFTVK